MKVILATISISCALPILNLSALAQASGGAGASGAAAGGAVGTGGAIGTAGAASARVGPITPVSPTGSLAGQGAAPAGTSTRSTLNTPAGNPVATPGTATPVGTVAPGGLSATPPSAVGRTFDRTVVGGAPTDTIVDPAAPQPTFRFPPATTLPQAVPDPAVGDTFPGDPVRIGNTVGTNFGRAFTSPVPREPVAVNLPPGARVTTNAFGVAEATVPPPVMIPTNAVGRGPGFESRSVNTREVPRPTAPPRNPSIVRP